MGLYDSIRSAKVSKSGSYYKPGMYKVEILHCKEVKSSQSSKVYFVIETKCLESDNEDIKVGGEYSQVIDLGNIMGMPNTKGFIAAASGFDPMMDDDELNELVENYWSGVLDQDVEFPQIAELITSSANPLGGLILDLECVNIKTKPTPKAPDGNDFTKHRWHPIDENAQAVAQ